MTRFFTNRTLLVLLAAVFVALAAGLRPDSFYSGDPGIKLIAARNAINHPLRPFDVTLPQIGGEPTPHVEPFFSVHGEHAHAVTSPLFPLVSAPFLALFGIRGLYVLPALGYLLAVAGCGMLAATLDPRRSALVAGAVAALATPFFFYGLEFWEHTPAVACATFALVMLLRGRPFWSGVLLGASLLLRPETIWFIAGIGVGLPLLSHRTTPAYLLRVAVGLLLTVAPYEAYVVAHFGTLIPPHVGTNAGGVTTTSWGAARWLLLQQWFLTGDASSFWRVGPSVVIAVVSLASARRYASDRFLWALAITTIALTVATAPNDGGSQWGPRYLLLAYVPLSLLAAGMLEQLRGQRATATTALVVVALGCLWVDRSGYRRLRSAKASYGRLIDFVADKTVESRDIVTDLWWLDQIAAASLGSHQLFFAPEAPTAASIIKRLSDTTVPVVHVIRSTSESIDTSSWRQGTCYFEERRDAISIRGLVSIQLRHRCGQESSD